MEHLGIKKILMEMLDHSDPAVRYEALVATQKLVMQNWSATANYVQCIVFKLMQVPY